MTTDFIPLSVPNLKGRELELVTTAVETEWVSTGGPYVSQFEENISEYVNAKGAVACQSGTAGLHIALMVLGVTSDDLVLVPALTFIAAANPIRYMNAEPMFLDCDSSLCIDPIKLERFCEEECTFTDGVLIHDQTDRPVRVLVVVHVFGNMADMEAIMAIADRYNIKVIEDATEALGSYYTTGQYEGKYAGTIGTIGVYSFNGNKIITTGGGGMIVSDDQELLDHARHLTTQAKSDVVYFEHDEIGYNYRMTNLQAALGIAQLEQLESFIETKNKNHEYYVHEIAPLENLAVLGFRPDIRSNKWFYSIVCEGDDFSRDDIIEQLSSNNIQSRPIWGIIPDQKPYAGSLEYCVEQARKYRTQIVNVPCSTNLTEEEIDRVVQVLKEISSQQ